MKDLIRSCRSECWAIVGALAIGFGGQAYGQVQAPPGPPPTINPKAEDRARQLDEGRLRSAELDAAAENENKKKIETAIHYMKEDFTRIQVLRNDIARNLVAHKPLDFELISRQTSEIHKRANRLNVYFVAHPSDDKAENRKEGVMIDDLVKLCKLIDSFTENPALKNASTLDVKHVDKMKEDKAMAEKDLVEIIRLSDTLHKRSDGLRGPY
jgi:hypothetical protein